MSNCSGAFRGRPSFRCRSPACGNRGNLRLVHSGRFLTDLDAISSPYVEDILDPGEARRMLLETVRGCRFGCKYCYYPKGCDAPRFLSTAQIVANLHYAVEHGVGEVVLLDPTLNQRPDFADFLRLLGRSNANGQLAFSGELRAEGIDPKTAGMLAPGQFPRSGDRPAIGRAPDVGTDGPANQPGGLRTGREGHDGGGNQGPG